MLQTWLLQEIVFDNKDHTWTNHYFRPGDGKSHISNLCSVHRSIVYQYRKFDPQAFCVLENDWSMNGGFDILIVHWSEDNDWWFIFLFIRGFLSLFDSYHKCWQWQKYIFYQDEGLYNNLGRCITFIIIHVLLPTLNLGHRYTLVELLDYHEYSNTIQNLASNYQSENGLPLSLSM